MNAADRFEHGPRHAQPEAAIVGTDVEGAIRWPEQRLRLKHHVFFRDEAEGVLFDAGHRQVRLPGRGVGRLAERLLGLMDQGRSLAEIQGLLPERLQPAAWLLLQALQRQQLLLDETEPWLGAADAPSALAEFIKHLQDRADPTRVRSLWAAWREGSVLLVGRGPALKCAARALADSGVGTLRVRLLGAGADELREHLRASGVAGQQVDARPSAAEDIDWGDLCGALWAVDGPEADAEAQALNFERQALRHGVPALLALRAGGRLLVAPPCEPGLPGVHDMLQWLPDGDVQPHSPASQAVAGVVAAQGLLDAHFGIGQQLWRRHVRSVSPYLELARHGLVVATGRSTAQAAWRPLEDSDFADLAGRPTDRVLSAYEQQRLALTPWFDAVFGPLCWRAAGSDGSLLSQLPLYHDAISVRAPRAAGKAPIAVAGWGLDAEQAGSRALQQAVSAWAAQMQPGDGASPFVTAFDRQRWQALATAHAVAAHPAFADQRRLAWLALGDVSDPTVHLLRQLLLNFAPSPTSSPKPAPKPAPTRALLHWHPLQAACVVQIFIDGQVTASACDASPLLALREALGQACSRLQLTDSALQRGPVWQWPEATPSQWQPAPPWSGCAEAHEAPLLQGGPDPQLNLPPGVFCGRLGVDLNGASA